MEEEASRVIATPCSDSPTSTVAISKTLEPGTFSTSLCFTPTLSTGAKRLKVSLSDISFESQLQNLEIFVHSTWRLYKKEDLFTQNDLKGDGKTLTDMIASINKLFKKQNFQYLYSNHPRIEYKTVKDVGLRFILRFPRKIYFYSESKILLMALGFQENDLEKAEVDEHEVWRVKNNNESNDPDDDSFPMETSLLQGSTLFETNIKAAILDCQEPDDEDPLTHDHEPIILGFYREGGELPVVKLSANFEEKNAVDRLNYQLVQKVFREQNIVPAFTFALSGNTLALNYSKKNVVKFTDMYLTGDDISNFVWEGENVKVQLNQELTQSRGEKVGEFRARAFNFGLDKMNYPIYLVSPQQETNFVTGSRVDGNYSMKMYGILGAVDERLRFQGATPVYLSSANGDEKTLHVDFVSQSGELVKIPERVLTNWVLKVSC